MAAIHNLAEAKLATELNDNLELKPSEELPQASLVSVDPEVPRQQQSLCERLFRGIYGLPKTWRRRWGEIAGGMGKPEPAPLPVAVVSTIQNEPYEEDRKVDEESIPLLEATPISEPIPRDEWTYKNTNASMVTLCHSWKFWTGAPSGIIESIAGAMRRDILQSSPQVPDAQNEQIIIDPDALRQQPQEQCLRSQEPGGLENYGTISQSPSIESLYTEPIGEMKIENLRVWENGLMLTIRQEFRREENPAEEKKYEESKPIPTKTQYFDIFVALTDRDSPHSVASYNMGSNIQKLVVSAKGDDFHHGQKIWNAGYRVVLKSVEDCLANCTNIER